MLHLVQQRVLAFNPMDGMKIPREGDARHARRALSDDEVARMLAATAAGPARYGMTPAQRVLLYKLALGTGLRVGEIRELIVSNLVLDVPRPYVFVRSSISKNRREARQPLPTSLANELRSFVDGREPEDKLFTPWPRTNEARMFRGDLRAARESWLDEVKGSEFKRRLGSGFLAYRDREGRYADLHSLRHTFITNLSRRGVPPAIAQRLARHHSIELTIGVYTHVGDAEAAAAVEALG
jgi:integrase